MADKNDRVIEIWDRVVPALREIVIDLAVTEEELHQAAEFFNQMGREGNFFTLLDATLATASLEAHARARGVSHANVLGPVYLPGAPIRPDGNIVEGELSEKSVPLEVSGRVYDAATGDPVPDAILDVWQSDQDGVYDRDGYHLRGLVPVDAEGRYVVKSVLPADYISHVGDTIADLYDMRGRHTYRAAHVHFKVLVGGVEVLTTQVFRSDSPRIDTDLVVGIVRPELVTDPIPPPPGSTDPWRMHFDIPVTLPSSSEDPGLAQVADASPIDA